MNRVFLAILVGSFASTAQSVEPYAEMYIKQANVVRTLAPISDDLTFTVNYSGLKRDVLDSIVLGKKAVGDDTWQDYNTLNNPYDSLPGTTTFSSSVITIANPDTYHYIRSEGRRDQPNNMDNVLMISDVAIVPGPSGLMFGFGDTIKVFEHPRDHYEIFVRGFLAVDHFTPDPWKLTWLQEEYPGLPGVPSFVIQETLQVQPGRALMYTFRANLDDNYINSEGKMRSKLTATNVNDIWDFQSIDSDFYPASRRHGSSPLSSPTGTRDVSSATVTNQAAQTATTFNYTFDWREEAHMDVAVVVPPGMGNYFLRLHWYDAVNDEDHQTFLRENAPTAGYELSKQPGYLPDTAAYTVTSRIIGTTASSKQDQDTITPNYDNSVPLHKVWSQALPP